MRRFFIALGMQNDKTMASYEMPSEVAEYAGTTFVATRQEE